MTRTLFVVPDENHFPQRCLIPGQYRQVISNLNLTRFVDYNGLYRDDLREPALSESLCGQHADSAEQDSSSGQQPFIFEFCAPEISGFYHVALDFFIQMLVPLMSSSSG